MIEVYEAFIRCAHSGVQVSINFEHFEPYEWRSDFDRDLRNLTQGEYQLEARGTAVNGDIVSETISFTVN